MLKQVPLLPTDSVCFIQSDTRGQYSLQVMFKSRRSLLLFGIVSQDAKVNSGITTLAFVNVLVCIQFNQTLPRRIPKTATVGLTERKAPVFQNTKKCTQHQLANGLAAFSELCCLLFDPSVHPPAVTDLDYFEDYRFRTFPFLSLHLRTDNSSSCSVSLATANRKACCVDYYNAV